MVGGWNEASFGQGEGVGMVGEGSPGGELGLRARDRTSLGNIGQTLIPNRPFTVHSDLCLQNHRGRSK